MPDPDDAPSFRPVHRPRRLRRTAALRDLVADVAVTPNDLILPLFVRRGSNLNHPVASMPGVAQMSPDVALTAMRDAASSGIRAFILFGVTDPSDKDPAGSAALDPSNPVHATLRSARDAGLDALLIADLCFCEYTNHGHCGVLRDGASASLSPRERAGVRAGSGPLSPRERAGVRAASDPLSPRERAGVRAGGVPTPASSPSLDNDATLPLLAAQAVSLASAGADVVAPSGMIDGMVGSIRSALDHANLTDTAILSYAIKYASSFYTPFREAGEGAPQHGDRRGYQMDFRRSREWSTELELDLAEGADMVMVKPAHAYLDIIRQVRDTTDVPVAAYHVSGEYSMLHAAADKGWLDLPSAAVEVTTAIKRSGADLIVTYFARDLLRWL